MFSETMLFDYEFINSKYKDVSRNTQISSKLQASEDKPERSWLKLCFQRTFGLQQIIQRQVQTKDSTQIEIKHFT